jgi:hypothetical protein
MFMAGGYQGLGNRLAAGTTHVTQFTIDSNTHTGIANHGQTAMKTPTTGNRRHRSGSCSFIRWLVYWCFQAFLCD